MKTNDQILKIRAALLYILQALPKGADYIKIFKILYYAQQSHLVKYGRVVVEDSFNAVKKGPVPAFLYKSLRCLVDDKISSDSIKLCIEGIEFTLTEDGIPIFSSKEQPDLEELSKSDIKCLDQSIKDNKKIDSKDLSEKSHEDKAWIEANERYNKDPELGNKITSIAIAKSGGASRGMINYIRENQLIDKALQYNG